MSKRSTKSKSTKKVVSFVAATPDAPAMSVVLTDRDRAGKETREVRRMEKANMHLTPAQFGAQLKQINADIKGLVKIAREVGAHKGGVEIGGDHIGPKELNALTTSLTKTVTQLKKNYTARGTRKPRGATTQDGKPRKQGRGFKIVSFLTDPMKQFLLNANFGMMPDGVTPIRSLIQDPVQQGYFTRAITTPLMVIYLNRNGLRYKDASGTHYRVNDEMRKYFGAWIDKLQADDAAAGVRYDKNGKQLDLFNPDRFGYNQIQRILQGAFLNKDQLNADQQAVVADTPKDPVTGLGPWETYFSQLQETISDAKKQIAPKDK